MAANTAIFTMKKIWILSVTRIRSNSVMKKRSSMLTVMG